MDSGDSRSMYIAVSIPSGISIIFCSLLISLYISKPDIRSLWFKMICHLLASDIMYCTGMILPTYNSSENDLICQAQAVILNTAGLLCTLWPCMIGLHLYLNISNRKTDGFMKWYIGLTWTLSLALGLSPLTQRSFGKSFGWCWVKPDSIIFEFVLSYIPIWIAIIVNFCVYTKIIIKSRKIIESVQESSDLRDLISKLKFYPLLSLSCRLPITISRVIEYFYEPNFYFVMVSAIIFCSQGMLDSILYGLNFITGRDMIDENQISILSRQFTGESHFNILSRAFTKDSQATILSSWPDTFRRA